MLLLLPKELCADILLRLSMKSLLISAFTCKKLLSFVISPYFKTAHMKKSQENPHIFLRFSMNGLLKEESEEEGLGVPTVEMEFYCLHPGKDSLEGDLDLVGMPVKSSVYGYLNIVGCCNGVLCLSDDLATYTDDMYLWNPCIRKSIQLPYPTVTFNTHGPYDMCLGFGFDKIVDDYKVIRLVYVESRDGPSILPPKVEIYTVRSGVWRNFEGLGPMYNIRMMTFSSYFFNDVVHWTGWKNGMWSTIVTFEIHEECFSEMKLPSALMNYSVFDKDLKVTSCSGMLTLIQMHKEDPIFRNISKPVNDCCIWVMKNYGAADSWIQIFKLTNKDQFPKPASFFFRREEILMLCNGCDLYSADFRKLLTVCPNRGAYQNFVWPWITHMAWYEESLGLFNQRNTMLDEASLGDDNEAEGWACGDE